MSSTCIGDPPGAAYFAIFAVTQTYFLWLIPVAPRPQRESPRHFGLPISFVFVVARLRAFRRSS
jgi:hypothetical protein